MPRATTINSLPSEVQDALRQRLLTTGFGHYEEHSEWLREQGFSVSKSAIHRYASTHGTTIKAQQQGGDSPSLLEARLRCLEIASSLQPGSTSELIRDAGELLKWVYGR
ncbi:phage protein Gp27 family protein [Alicycliphilus denitrificans]|uniref:phage protein Gp27 family protein n=1 Tax=Alicycliphilus denitrificans TaxID=179636 RepID=UPI0009DAD400